MIVNDDFGIKLDCGDWYLVLYEYTWRETKIKLYKWMINVIDSIYLFFSC